MTKLSDLVDKLAVDKYHFIMRRIIVRGKIDEVVEVILDIATQEETLCQYPANWLEALKERWFFGWLKKRFPVRMKQVIAVHKFPELDAPVGREFVHLRIVDQDKLMKELEEQREREELTEG